MKYKKLAKHIPALTMLTVFILLSCESSKKTEVADSTKEEATKREFGVQVYSVRDSLEGDFAGSMKKIADMGYSYIEAYDLQLDGTIFNMTAAEYRKTVEDLGMSIVSSHATYFTPDEADPVIKAAQDLGLKYVMIPWINEDLRKDYMAVASNLNELGKKFKGSGVKIGYHNHDFEFELTENEQVPLELMIQNTDPELVTFQLDLYWVVKAGFDPMELIKKYPGRFSSFHVKDANDSLEQTTVGTGIIDFKTILAAQETSSHTHYFVEDEREENPFENIQADFDYVDQLEF